MSWWDALPLLGGKPKRKVRAVQSVTAAPVDPLCLSGPERAAIFAAAEQMERARGGHVGMQGYAPGVAISVGRRFCDYCGERAETGVRHICWGNAEHHMATLTAAERAKVLAQLASRPKKLTRAQLRKLYRS